MRKIGERFLVREKMPSPGPCDYFENNDKRKLKSSKYSLTLNVRTENSLQSSQ